MLWIPGYAEHGTENVGDEDLVWLYVFAADGFEEILYRFDEPGPRVVKAKLCMSEDQDKWAERRT